MPYITPDDLNTRGTDVSYLNDVDHEEKLRACEEASSTADSYFARRYGVPLPSPSPETKRRVRHVAIYEIMCGIGFAADNPGHQVILSNYQDSIRWFESVAKGTAVPTLVADATPSVSEGAPLIESDTPWRW